MGAPKLLGGVALIGSTVFYILPMSMHLVSAHMSVALLSVAAEIQRDRDQSRRLQRACVSPRSSDVPLPRTNGTPKH